MKYIKPTYENERLEAEDIILSSIMLDGGATLVEKDASSAKVGASALDVLGLR